VSSNSDTTLSWSRDGRIFLAIQCRRRVAVLGFQGRFEELPKRRSRCSASIPLASVADGQFLMAVGQAAVSCLLLGTGGSGIRPMAFEPLPLGSRLLDSALWQPDGLAWRVAAGRQCAPSWDEPSVSWAPLTTLSLPGSCRP